MLGTVWPDYNTAFPDFLGTGGNATEWWIQEIQNFYRNVSFDGLWIDMNEPANFGTNNKHPWYFNDPNHLNTPSLFCPRNKWDYPPYETYAAYNFHYINPNTHLFNKTLCMLGQHGPYRHYDVHNLYGWSESGPTYAALKQTTGKRGVVISRSTFPSSGRYTGHWLGDNYASYDDLRTSIIGAMEFNMFGIPYVGADVCGFGGNSNAELCLRWSQLGAFHPFFRNHNAIGNKDQDPAAWGPFVAKQIAKAINFRYHYLPYLYTLMHHSSAHGSTTVRPLFFDFMDNHTLDNNLQFTWGGGLLVTPVIAPGQTNVTGYIPKNGQGEDCFYSVYDFDYGKKVNTSGSTGGWLTFQAPNTSLIPVHVRDSRIYPRQKPALRLTSARWNPLELLVVPDANQVAAGDLFWDNGDAIIQNHTQNYQNFYYFEFSYASNTTGAGVNQSQILIWKIKDGSQTNVSIPQLGIIEIFNYPGQPVFSSFQWNGVALSLNQSKCYYNPRTKILFLVLTNLNLVTANSTSPGSRLSWSWQTSVPLLDERMRVDCHPEPGFDEATQANCLARQCIFDDNPTLTYAGAPRCFYPPGTGYRLNETVHLTNNKMEYQLAKMGIASKYGPSIAQLWMTTQTWQNQTIQIKLTEKAGGTTSRYVPPVTLPNYNYPYTCDPGFDDCDTLRLNTNVTGNGVFAFQVARQSNGRILFDTSIEGLTFTDQYISISAYVGTNFVYGWGENTHQTLNHDLTQFKTWSMFARDEAPDSPHEDRKNAYGVHPFYLGLESDGKAHGVLIFNSNAQEVILGPGPSGFSTLTYRTIGGILDLYFFPGPTPDMVIQQYLSLIGRPMFPAYWGLGFQLSRWGYMNISNVEMVINRNEEAGIPQETQTFDIDYMYRRRDFTFDPTRFNNFTGFVKALHQKGIHVITIIDPAIEVSYQTFVDGKAANAFVMWDSSVYAKAVSNCSQHHSTTNPPFKCPVNNLYSNSNGTQIMLGTVWPQNNTAFPDFIANRQMTKTWWLRELQNFYGNVSYDGLWIDMNEPSNFATNNPAKWWWYQPYLHHANTTSLYCPATKWDEPAYETWSVYHYGLHSSPRPRLYSKTLCMAAVHQGPSGSFRHYDVHNLYGWSESEPTQEAVHQITGKRGLVLSRSTFVSSGRYTGHWLGDNNAGWDDMRTSLIGSVEFNLFGISYIGADVCGFHSDSTAELCLRWQQLGVLYTFYRNHNNLGQRDQDPAVWGPVVANASKKAINFRYHYLPYLYTLMWNNHQGGQPVIRPLFFDFNDTTSRSVSAQVTWGGGLLFTPVLQPGVSSVKGWFPKAGNPATDVFYSIYDFNYGQRVNTSGVAGGYLNLQAPNTSMIPVHARDGKIYPRQAPALRLSDARQNPLELLIIPCSQSGMAMGELFWDNGNDINQTATPGSENYYFFHFHYFTNAPQQSNTLRLHMFQNGSNSNIPIPTLDILEIFNYQFYPDWTSFTLNSVPLSIDRNQSYYDARRQIMYIHMVHLVQLPSVLMTGHSELSWNYSTTLPPTTRMTPETKRVDCHPDPGASPANCLKRWCWYDSRPQLMHKGTPRCYYPPGTGYSLDSKHLLNFLQGYSITPDPIIQNTFNLNKVGTPSPFQADIQNLVAQTSTVVNNTLRLAISDIAIGNTNRYQVPLALPRGRYPYNCDSFHPCDNTIRFQTYTNPNTSIGSFQVVRNSTNRLLFDMSIEGLTFSDQYISLSAYLPSRNVYGFGEHTHQSLRHDLSQFKTWPMFARDQPPESGHEARQNSYGVHAFYVCVEPDGNAHGVFFYNSNAQEVVLGPGPDGKGSLTWRSIGGVIDVYFFPGPQPDQVIQQYLSFIGRPYLPSYWSLGFILSRWGYRNISHAEQVIARTEAAGIPQEAQTFDIDSMYRRRDFTFDPNRWANITGFVQALAAKGIHQIQMVDPAIEVTYDAFTSALNKSKKYAEVFVKWDDQFYQMAENQCQPSQQQYAAPKFNCPLNNLYNSTKGTKVMLGTCWPQNNTAYPDWLGNYAGTKSWWQDELSKLHSIIGYSGLWIDMNEPSNFATNNPQKWWTVAPYLKDFDHLNTPSLYCPLGNKWEEPPYETWNVYYYGLQSTPRPRLFTKTLCMSATHGFIFRHYNVHSLYGISESLSTRLALTAINKKRGMVLSRSTFASSGQYVSHWLGDNKASWDDMRTSLIGAVEFNMFGIPHIGADVCGYHDQPTAELCLRWQQLGIIYTFYRNHNDYIPPDQDPAVFGPTVIAATKKAINFRYHYLPFLYTLMYTAHTEGQTVIRPLWFDYGDPTSLTIDRQVTWGGGLLFTPVLQPGVSTVKGWFPKTAIPDGHNKDVFYSVYDFNYGQRVNTSGPTGGWLNLQAPNSSMIPVHARDAKIYPRQGSALRLRDARRNPMDFLVIPDADGQAVGELFWDDGESTSISQTNGIGNYYLYRFHYFQNVTSASLHIRMLVSAVDSGLKIPSLDIIEVFNFPGVPDYGSFDLDGQPVAVDQVRSSYNPINRVLYLHTNNLINLTAVRTTQHHPSILSWTWMNGSTGINLPETERVDCHPEPYDSLLQQTCLRRQCIFDNRPFLSVDGAPRCYYPPQTGFSLTNNPDPHTFILSPQGSSSPYPSSNSFSNITLSQQKLSDGFTLNVKIADRIPTNRYTPPVPFAHDPYPYLCDHFNQCQRPDNLIFNATSTPNSANGLFSFTVRRGSNGRVLFDTSPGGMIFSDQYIQIAAYSPTQNVYGWGEQTHQTLKHDMSKVKLWPMFARDEAPDSGLEDHKNAYGVHPFYICVESDGKTHGVLIMNSNAQEVQLGPGPNNKGLIQYRTIGGILDFYFFPGPTPDQVIQQYLSLIGRPMFPAYWGLGFQLSRWGYYNLSNVEKVIARNEAANVPQEAQTFDIDYMHGRRDFTFDTTRFHNFSGFVDNLHSKHMHVITILDPAIAVDYSAFTDGLSSNVYVQWDPAELNEAHQLCSQNSTDFNCPANNLYPATTGTQIMLGTVWPNNNTAFPDFIGRKQNATDWWINEIRNFYARIKFDGLWIDMNEVSNFATNNPVPWWWYTPQFHHSNTTDLFCPPSNKFDNPPYQTWAVYTFQYAGNPNPRLFNKTLCMSALFNQYRHYDVHSLYGWSESQPTQEAVQQITGKRGTVLSRSTFVSSGRYTGHWLGDNNAGWDDMRTSLIGSVEFNMFGIPYIGADVCGFNSASQEELCLRWQQLGAFYTFYRNHNAYGNPDQDPAAWGSLVANASRKAINFRYHYLPFLYTLMYRANAYGQTVIQPLFFQHPTDPIALNINNQVTWGGKILFTPVITPGVDTVKGYFPRTNGADVWYSIYDINYGQLVNTDGTNGWMTMPAPNTTLPPVHARAGWIYPRQAPALRLAHARKNPLELLVVPDNTGNARGELFWDDGESINSKASRNFYYLRFGFQPGMTGPKSSLINFVLFNNASLALPVPTINIIEIFDYPNKPVWSSFRYQNQSINVDTTWSSYDPSTKILLLNTTGFISIPQMSMQQRNYGASLMWNFH